MQQLIKLLSLITVIFCLACIQNVSAAVWYVDGTVAPSGAGTGWSSPFKTVQEAIDAAGDSDEIWIRMGTYLLSKEITVDKTVSLYGGFDGTETQLSQRDWQNNVATIDGQDNDRCLNVTGNNVIIDGLSITRGYVPDICELGSPPCYGGQGGGIYFLRKTVTSADPVIYYYITIRNCSISDCNVTGEGAGLYVYAHSAIVENCAFSGNSASGEYGQDVGGAFFSKSEEGYTRNCNFINNSALASGGISVKGYAPVSDCTFIGNTAEIGGGAVTFFADMTNCVFIGNEATRGGGGLATNYDDTIISGCIFKNNTAQQGGAIYINNPSVFENCSITGYEGGGIFIETDGSVALPQFTNCTIANNTATFRGGGFYEDRNYLYAAMTNTIVWGNTAGWEGNEIYLRAMSVDARNISYCNIDQDGYSGSNNNIRQDPLFVDPGNGDFTLQTGSPCIDAGTSYQTPLIDFDGNLRYDDPSTANTGGGTLPYYDIGA